MESDHQSDATNPQQTEEEQLKAEHIKKYGLKIKLYILNCGFLCFNELGHNMAKRFNNKLDYFEEDPMKIFHDLQNSKFLEYSTILLTLNGYCRCRVHILQALLFCISDNIYLRYKSKLIMLNNVERCCTKSYRGTNLYYSLSDDIQFNTGIYDNMIVFTNFVQNEMDTSQWHVIMSLIEESSPMQSIQQILKPGQRPTKHEVVRSSTNAELYFYTINPALAIIVNNYYFTQNHSIREGSEQDVIKLIRELKIARIPYILIEDCDRQELLKILSYIERKDFKPLKSFLFFLMSHGDEENVIYTHDGYINTKTDVIDRIQANKSLEDAETLIVLNACRGDIDWENANEEVIDEIKPTGGENLKNNTIVLYSVRDRMQSPRSTQDGCPYIQRFCHHFRTIDHTHDIRDVDAKIDDDLKKLDYFYGLDKCSELVVNDQSGNVSHKIIHTPTHVVGMMKLIDSILGDFPTGNKESVKTPEEEEGAWGGVEENDNENAGLHKMRTLFHICGTLNEMKFPKGKTVQKYYSAELDKD